MFYLISFMPLKVGGASVRRLNEERKSLAPCKHIRRGDSVVQIHGSSQNKLLRYFCMIRASTPTHYFTLPTEYNIDNIDKILVTYAQKDKVVLEKTKEDVSFDGATFYYTLTQEETNLFEDNVFVEIQVRIKTSDGNALPSDIYHLPVKKVLNDEVL